MNQNLSNEDELQKAIDDITNNATNNMPAGDTGANLMANNTPVMPEANQATAMDMKMPDPINDQVMSAAPDFVAPEPMMATVPKVDDKPVGGPVDMPTAEPNPVVESASIPEPVEPVKPEMKQPEEPEELAELKPELKPEVSADNEMSDVKEKALRDLMPLINKMNINSDQKVKILFDGMEILGDKSIADELYEAISQISDDNAKGEALLKLVEKLD